VILISRGKFHNPKFSLGNDGGGVGVPGESLFILPIVGLGRSGI
jgi:hypothetical protein